MQPQILLAVWVIPAIDCHPTLRKFSILDPILHDLLDPNIKWTSTTLQLNGKQLQGFLYARPVDQRYMSHLLEILLSVVRFGGQGFMKTVRGTPVQRSLSPQFKQRVDDCKLYRLHRANAY